MIKDSRKELTARYLAALRHHLDHRGKLGSGGARSLGRAALSGGMVQLDLAVMHKKAVSALALSHDFSNARNGDLKRAGGFLAASLIPLEAARRMSEKDRQQLLRHNATLQLHARSLATVNRQLRREVKRRQEAELDATQSKEEFQALLLSSQIMQAKLRQLTRQIISAQEEERKMISRELHDEVVQILIGINVQLSTLADSEAKGARTLKEKIARTQRLVKNSVNAVHRFARELRPAALDDLGLIPALHAYSKNLAAQKKISIQIVVNGSVEALSGARRIVMFRVAQEALTNVARHACATEIQIRISRTPGVIRMEICDNGKSFSVEKTFLVKNPKRLGLVGMKERIEMVGGSLAIESAPDKGTTVRVELPSTDERPRL
jgi:signal transduction histidine kinase